MFPFSLNACDDSLVGTGADQCPARRREEPAAHGRKEPLLCNQFHLHLPFLRQRADPHTGEFLFALCIISVAFSRGDAAFSGLAHWLHTVQLRQEKLRILETGLKGLENTHLWLPDRISFTIKRKG